MCKKPLTAVSYQSRRKIMKNSQGQGTAIDHNHDNCTLGHSHRPTHRRKGVKFSGSGQQNHKVVEHHCKRSKKYTRADQENNNADCDGQITPGDVSMQELRSFTPSSSLDDCSVPYSVAGGFTKDHSQPKAKRQRGSKMSPIPSKGSRPAVANFTPMKSISPVGYAGARFSDPPSPKVLPKPPTHWVNLVANSGDRRCAEMTSVLKVMLKVQC